LNLILIGKRKKSLGKRRKRNRSYRIMRLSIAQYSFLEFGQSITAQIESGKIQALTLANLQGINSQLFLSVFLNIGFTHHIMLLQKCPDIVERFFYMNKAIKNQWSVNVLEYHIFRYPELGRICLKVWPKWELVKKLTENEFDRIIEDLQKKTL